MSLKAEAVETVADVPETSSFDLLEDESAAFATSRMIQAMEIAAARLMRRRLAAGQSSVGIEMNLTYASTSALRARSTSGPVRAVAEYLGVAGRLHRFSINAFDESGLVGSCEHARSVV